MAISATSNSRSRTTRLKAVCGTFTSAKSSSTSGLRTRPVFQGAGDRIVAEKCL